MMLTVRGLSLPGRLSEASLDVAAGELVCLVGPNGGGKTSLLHAVAGVGEAGGSVRIDGIDPRRLGAARRSAYLTYLPATREIAWPLPARDVIALGGGAARFPDLALEPLLDRRVDTLSTGERSRVLIARALAPRPKLLLLDEPTANLDPLWQIRLMELVRAEIAHGGRAAIVAIHDLDAAERYADRILLMDRGTIVGEGLERVAEVFGVTRRDGRWIDVRRPAGPRSSR
jgi:iron complex transport system ATP-binding protein